MSVSGKRIPILLSCAVLMLATFVTVFRGQSVSAEQITDRTLTLQTGSGGDGGSMPSGEVNHRFTFTVPSSGNQDIGSIRFQYCTTADINIGGTCTTPAGLDTQDGGITLNETGSAATGFTLENEGPVPNGAPYITRTAAQVNANSNLVFTLEGVTNPDGSDCTDTAPNCTFYVHISTYTGTDGATGLVDSGTVAAAVVEQIQLEGTMPESLVFCTGGSIDVNAEDIPLCSTASSGSVNFNQLFSPEVTAWATSQFAASTNALSGYVITVSGPTLTSGGNTIPVIGGTAATSAPGSGQFGLNIVDNDSDLTIGSGSPNPIIYYDDGESPADGDVYPAANGTNYKGQPSSNFDTASSFAFVASTNNIVAASDHTGAGPTDSQRFTATYIVNVSGSQPAGTYVTTLTYIATATF
jgi:hypothetical protein